MTNPWGETENSSGGAEIPWHTPRPAPWGADLRSGAPSLPRPGAQPGSRANLETWSAPVAPSPACYQPPGVPTSYGTAGTTATAAIDHIRWLAAAGWPPEAIASDLAIRRYPTLGGNIPLLGNFWRPYMIRRIIAGEAPSARNALLAGLICWLINPFLLCTVASIIFFVHTRKEIRASQDTLQGVGKAAVGLALGISAGLINLGFLILTIVMTGNRSF